MDNIKRVLKDDRRCRSKNMQSFFRKVGNRRYTTVIRHKDQLWFVTLGWLVKPGIETGFAGVEVRSVACFGSRASTGYPIDQNGDDYEIVTDWFWEKYWDRGMVSLPEIWNIKIPPELTHAEHHTL